MESENKKTTKDAALTWVADNAGRLNLVALVVVGLTAWLITGHWVTGVIAGVLACAVVGAVGLYVTEGLNYGYPNERTGATDA